MLITCIVRHLGLFVVVKNVHIVIGHTENSKLDQSVARTLYNGIGFCWQSDHNFPISAIRVNCLHSGLVAILKMIQISPVTRIPNLNSNL